MQEWHTSPKVMNETVRIAKEFLEKNPDVLKKYIKGKSHGTDAVGFYADSVIITKFLNWDDRRVRESLEQLRATGQIPDVKQVEKGKWVEEKEIKKEQIIIDRKVLENLPSRRVATEGVKTAKKTKASSLAYRGLSNLSSIF